MIIKHGVENGELLSNAALLPMLPITGCPQPLPETSHRTPRSWPQKSRRGRRNSCGPAACARITSAPNGDLTGGRLRAIDLTTTTTDLKRMTATARTPEMRGPPVKHTPVQITHRTTINTSRAVSRRQEIEITISTTGRTDSGLDLGWTDSNRHPAAAAAEDLHTKVRTETDTKVRTHPGTAFGITPGQDFGMHSLDIDPDMGIEIEAGTETTRHKKTVTMTPEDTEIPIMDCLVTRI